MKYTNRRSEVGERGLPKSKRLAAFIKAIRRPNNLTKSFDQHVNNYARRRQGSCSADDGIHHLLPKLVCRIGEKRVDRSYKAH